MEFIMGPWPWYVGGPLVALIMLTLVYLGRSFGFSSNFRNICAMVGAGKHCSFFDFNWKSQSWNLLFLLGSVIGGFLAAHFLSENQAPAIAESSMAQLQTLGIESAGAAFSPTEIFNSFSLQNLLIWSLGGLLIGFGTRYAGGCTSGHAISGLSNLQWPSLVAVIGFFIGGLFMVHVLFPIIF